LELKTRLVKELLN